MKKISSIRQLFQRPAKGQSLVEMAITAPILIFLMIGVFEVGWALRGYLVLSNVNREITRFAVRPGYLNFSTHAEVITSYQRIRDWVDTANTGQINLNFSKEITGNATLIVSHVVVDTGNPYDRNAPATDNPATEWNCEALSTPGTNPFPKDDIIVHPGISTYAYQAESFPATSTVRTIPTTRISYTTLVTESLIPQNNKFNCEIIKKGGVASANNFVITEIFFDQPQLVGFPLISNPFTDPVPLYGHTVMRLSAAARSSGGAEGSIIANIDSVGPLCDAYPFIIRDITIDYPNPSSPQLNTKVDIFGGNGPDDFGWLGWNGISTTDLDNGYLSDELRYPQMSVNDFYDAHDNSDRGLSVDDWVASLSGDQASVESSGGLVSALMGLERFRIPVWDQFQAGSPDAYHIVGFIWVRIESETDINLPGKTVMARYLGDASEGCVVP